MDAQSELYQEIILEHNKKPKNFRVMENFTHYTEGYNPICGDHVHVYLNLKDDLIEDVSFEGHGCAISKASASMMTEKLKGKSIKEALTTFEEFHNLLLKKLDPSKDQHDLGSLKIFSGIWQFPARVKCASLPWHALKGALKKQKSVTTE